MPFVQLYNPEEDEHGLSMSHSFPKRWTYTLTPEESVFSFSKVICIPDLLFHLESVHLIIREEDELEAPLPVYSTAAKRIPGCALQAAITDVAGIRRKFVIGVYSSNEPQKNVDFFFDEEQLKSLSISMVGRPHLIAKRCEIQLAGTFFSKIPFGPELSKAIKENGQTELEESLKLARLAKQIESNAKSTKKDKNADDNEEAMEDSSDEEVEEDRPSTLQQIGPKSFINKGVSIFQLIAGHGRKVQIGDRIKIVYKGKLDPTKSRCFDKATIVRPFEFTVGSKKVISGINLGVEGMCVEGVRELIIPSHLGFGQAGLGDRVPPNSTLYYDVTVKEIIPKGSWRKQQKREHKESQEKKSKQQKEKARLLHVGNKIKI